MIPRRKPQATPQILIADDEPVICDLFARQLRTAGFDVREAPSGAEAMRLLRGSTFQLLVLNLDLRLQQIGGYDGFEVLKIVRSEFPRLPILVISGYLQGSVLKAAEFLGARLTLEKSCASQLLVESAKKILTEN